MQCFLVIALFQWFLPDRGTTNLSSLTNQQITASKAKALEIGRRQLDKTNVTDVRPTPLNRAIA